MEQAQDSLNYLSQNSHQDFQIKIKTLDNSFVEFNVNGNMTIEYLKKSIEEIMKIPFNRQRLIFRGRLLNNFEKISHCKIEPGNVIHLVANSNQNTENAQQQQNTEINSNNSQNDNNQQQQFQFQQQQFPQQQQNIDNHGEQDVLQGLFRTITETSMNRTNQRRREMQTRGQGWVINEDEVCETIQQNLQTNKQIMRSFKNVQEVFQQEQLNIYNFSNRQFLLGQWVDVKDTIDQWLEAQVIDINDQTKQVLIHYNGWGNRWDEWIPFSSQRIAPFRTHSVQQPNGQLFSPFPSNQRIIKNMENSSTYPEILQDINMQLTQIAQLTQKLSSFKQDQEERKCNQQQKPQYNSNLNVQALSGISQQYNKQLEKSSKNSVGGGDNDTTSQRSYKSIKSEKQSMDYDVSSIKSMKSDMSHISKFTGLTNFPPNKYQLDENICEEEDSEDNISENEIKEEQKMEEKEMNKIQGYLLSSQLAPLFDRMGRLLIDLAPTLAMHGTKLQNVNNHQFVMNLSNLSLLTNEGSMYSFQQQQQQINQIIQQQQFQQQQIFFNSNQNSSNQINSQNNLQFQQHIQNQNQQNQALNVSTSTQSHDYYFQVPIMLTPMELIQVNSQSQLQNTEQVDIHIHAQISNPNSNNNMQQRNGQNQQNEMRDKETQTDLTTKDVTKLIKENDKLQKEAQSQKYQNQQIQQKFQEENEEKQLVQNQIYKLSNHQQQMFPFPHPNSRNYSNSLQNYSNKRKSMIKDNYSDWSSQLSIHDINQRDILKKVNFKEEQLVVDKLNKKKNQTQLQKNNTSMTSDDIGSIKMQQYFLKSFDLDMQNRCLEAQSEPNLQSPRENNSIVSFGDDDNDDEQEVYHQKPNTVIQKKNNNLRLSIQSDVPIIRKSISNENSPLQINSTYKQQQKKMTKQEFINRYHQQQQQKLQQNLKNKQHYLYLEEKKSDDKEEDYKEQLDRQQNYQIDSQNYNQMDSTNFSQQQQQPNQNLIYQNSDDSIINNIMTSSNNNISNGSQSSLVKKVKSDKKQYKLNKPQRGNNINSYVHGGGYSSSNNNSNNNILNYKYPKNNNNNNNNNYDQN